MQFVSSLNSWSTVYSFSILFTLDVVQGSEHWAPSTNSDLPSTGYMEGNMNQGWGEWMRKFMWSWHEQSRHRSMLVPSDLGAGTQWVLSCPSRSPTACWSYGEGEKEASPWGFAAAVELRITPLLLSSHKASHPLWAETQCEGLPPDQQFILEPGQAATSLVHSGMFQGSFCWSLSPANLCA